MTYLWGWGWDRRQRGKYLKQNDVMESPDEPLRLKANESRRLEATTDELRRTFERYRGR